MQVLVKSLLFFMLSDVAMAAKPAPLFSIPVRKIFTQLRCHKEVVDVLKTWKSLGNWSKHASPLGNDGVILRTPTQDLGTWAGVQVSGKEGTLELIRTLGAKRVTFDNNCKVQTEAVMAAPAKEFKNKFTDAHLKSFMADHNNGLIYTWSTQMPWSVKGIKEIKEAAKKLNLPVLVLMSPTSDSEEVRKLLKSGLVTKEETKTHMSLEFYMRGMTLHDPGVLWFKDQRLARFARPGHEFASLYVNYFSKEFKQ